MEASTRTHLQVGSVIRDDILADAYDYFTGDAVDIPSDLDMDELDDDDEDDDASVDLEDEEEQPTRKKQKN